MLANRRSIGFEPAIALGKAEANRPAQPHCLLFVYVSHRSKLLILKYWVASKRLRSRILPRDDGDAIPTRRSPNNQFIWASKNWKNYL